ncbi:MAG: AMP-binding protein, partial [Actinophytocola sp.]|uniref:AMP-binding protein n=1 Tax=Actinophytocola sp. TaxID=1872138 RepID=UPI003D6B4D7A
MSASEPTLLDVLARHPLILDAAVVTRAAEDGRTFRVAYVVPDPEAAPERVRKVAGALAAVARSPEPVLVATVTAIPRDEHGAPDEAGLSELAVPGSVTPRPVALPAPEPGRRHLGDVVDLPRPWAAGPLPGLSGAPSDVDAGGPPSRCAGGELDIRAGDPATLVDALLAAAESYPDAGVHVVQDGGTVLLRYPELLHAARRTLTGLRAAGLQPGDAAVLHTPSLAEHIVGLWACLLGGFRPVAVAQSATYDTRTAVLDKLEHAWLDLARPTVLSGGATVGALRDYSRREGLDGLRVVDLADCAEDAAAEPHRPAPGDVAMLQLSSGSTGRPKVIQVTHHGLVRYAQGARQAGRMSTGDVFVNWLPLDHVGGVVMFHFGPVVLGCDNVHVPPERVLADPLLWLDLLDRFQAQHSWSPNFGYGLVADALAARPDRDWDLRGLKVLMNAGEQCTEPVTRRFLDAVRRFGVEDHTILLAWGMAETCTAVTYEPFGPAAVQHVRQAAPGRPLELLDAPAPGATTFLSMGAPAPGAEFRIAGADGRTELPELHIGRLQGRSPRITPGYLNNPDANAEAFPDGEWFDTGDLAFVAGGRVTITGRAKEIIIINGVHYYCHEIEDVVGALDGVARSFAGAFGIPGADGVERLAVVFVPEPGPDGLAPVVDRIRRRLSERFGLVSVVLVAVDRDSFDKTTSGKIQRTAMRGRLLRGELDRHLRAVELAEAGPHTMPDTLHRPGWTARVLPAGRTPERVVLLTGDAALSQALPGAVVAGPDEDWRDAVAGADVLVVAPVAHPSTVDQALTACADDVLALTAFLAAEGWTGELVTVSRGRYVITGAEPPGYPAALTEAIGESFALEHAGVRAWHLDLPGDDRDPAVLAEALTWTHREPVLAWRDVPMARTLRPVVPRPGGTAALAPGSCWLVTGGLGGVG